MSESGVSVMNVPDTIALGILGGRSQVCAQLLAAIQGALETDGPRARRTASASGIHELDALIAKLKSNDRLELDEALGMLNLLSGVGLAINNVLPIAPDALTDARRTEIESMMNAQISGPRYADNGATKFDSDSATKLFIRLQGVEDLCA